MAKNEITEDTLLVKLDAEAETDSPRSARQENEKYMGKEPLYNPAEILHEDPAININTKLGKLFNWYNYFYGKKDAKFFILQYCRLRGIPETKIVTMNKFPEEQVITAAGWVARQITLGIHPGAFPKNAVDFLEQQIEKMAGPVPVEPESSESTEEKREKMSKPEATPKPVANYDWREKAASAKLNPQMTAKLNGYWAAVMEAIKPILSSSGSTETWDCATWAKKSDVLTTYCLKLVKKLEDLQKKEGKRECIKACISALNQRINQLNPDKKAA